MEKIILNILQHSNLVHHFIHFQMDPFQRCY
nr:MAG TPA: Quinolinate phosphoribosyl transferase, N-terminal domain [Caudoviricetes sp.]